MDCGISEEEAIEQAQLDVEWYRAYNDVEELIALADKEKDDSK